MRIFYGDQDGNIQKAQLVTAGITFKWSQLVGNGNQPANPIITGAGVGGGGGVGVGALFRIPFAGGSTILGSTDSPTWNAIEIAGNKVVVGSNKGSLYIEDEVFPSSGAGKLTAAATLSGAVTGAPAFGSDQTLHIASSDKKLFVRDAAGAALWDADLGAASYSSPALDCARDSNGQKISAPGVVYVGADDGFLYAFVTDSHGLDTTSPWPKFHRDPKNRANTAYPLAEFECP
ncbi:MAG: PQQ-binding-like beta-propeller repeat protein [Myxococcales bacterium]